MAWITMIDERDAGAELREAYAGTPAAGGRVANILKIHSVSPKAMTAHLALYKQLMFAHSELTRRERETIAVAVSAANQCHY